MKLSHPFLSSFLLIFLFVFISLFAFQISLSKGFNKEKIKDYLNKVDLVYYIKQDENIKEELNNKKIPEQIFNYINYDKKEELISFIVDNLYSDKKDIVDYNDIVSLIYDSVHIYEKLNSVEVYEYLDDSVIGFAKRISSEVNSGYSLNGFVLIKNFLSLTVSILLFTFSMVLLFLLYVYERKNTFLLMGLLFIVISFFLFLFNYQIISSNFNIYLFNEAFLNCFEFIYVLLFLIGSIMLINYLIYVIRYAKREFRIRSYYRR